MLSQKNSSFVFINENELRRFFYEQIPGFLSLFCALLMGCSAFAGDDGYYAVVTFPLIPIKN